MPQKHGLDAFYTSVLAAQDVCARVCVCVCLSQRPGGYSGSPPPGQPPPWEYTAPQYRTAGSPALRRRGWRPPGPRSHTPTARAQGSAGGGTLSIPIPPPPPPSPGTRRCSAEVVPGGTRSFSLSSSFLFVGRMAVALRCGFRGPDPLRRCPGPLPPPPPPTTTRGSPVAGGGAGAPRVGSYPEFKRRGASRESAWRKRVRPYERDVALAVRRAQFGLGARPLRWQRLRRAAVWPARRRRPIPRSLPLPNVLSEQKQATPETRHWTLVVQTPPPRPKKNTFGPTEGRNVQW